MHSLFQRYLSTFRHAWQHRRELDSPARHTLEAEFLPAALSLRDTPAPAAPRVLMLLLALTAVTGLLWGFLGQVDIVATAHGKIVPDDYTKVVQAPETGVIRAIHVRDGQFVKSGTPLIDLDTTISVADVTRLRSEYATAKLQEIRSSRFWQAINGGKPPDPIVAPRYASPAQIGSEQRLLEGMYKEFISKVANLDAELARHRAEFDTISQTIRKLEQTAPLAEQRARDYRDLTDRNFMSKHAWLEKEQQSIELRQDLETERARQLEVHATLQETAQRRESLIAETARVALDQQHEAEVQAAGLEQELIKADQRNRLMQITAPIDGRVQQLAVHTLGGVATAAQELLSVVPLDRPLRIEAWLPNKDIGFVRENQTAEVKIETFNFTRYGTIPANIEHVSRDAVQDEKLGLVYLMRVRLQHSSMIIDGQPVNLSPGMASTVEIKTGKRRLIEYFLSPLIQYRNDSLRER